MVYSHIIHLADIHIRTTRQEEYYEVFNRLFDLIKKYAPKPLILICGDVVHERPKHSAEVIKTVLYFLNNLAEIGKTVLINGNHDFYENNEKKYKILEVLPKPENLDYITKSGTYQYENILLSVNALDDEPYISYYDICHPEKERFHNVAVGHYTLTSELARHHRGYDISFLGDLHERHMRNPNCYYSGSLIQQNHGESRNKGFGIYNLQTKRYKYIDVHNDYAFVTLETSETTGDIIELELPKNSYIRLRRALKFQHRDNEYRQQIGLLTNLLSFRIEVPPIGPIAAAALVAGIPQQIQFDEPSIEEILGSNHPQKMELVNMHRDYMKSHEDSRRQIQESFFSLHYFEMEGILSYKDKVAINFKDLEGIIGIHGNNATGKSNILKAIIFALCGDITVEYATMTASGQRGTSNRSSTSLKYSYDIQYLLNNLSKKGYTRIEFFHGKNKYRIHREIIIATRDGRRRATVALFKEASDGGGWVSLTKTKKETDKDIFDMVGKSALFILTNVYNREATSFLSCNVKERYNIISNLLDLEAYESILKILDDEVKQLRVLKTADEAKANYILTSTGLNPTEQINIAELSTEQLNLREDISTLQQLLTPDIEARANNKPEIIEEAPLLRKKLNKMQSYVFPEKLPEKTQKLLPEETIPDVFTQYHQLKHIQKPTTQFTTKDLPIQLPEPYKTDVFLEDLEFYHTKTIIASEYSRDEILSILAKYNYKHVENTVKTYNDNLEPFESSKYIPLTEAAEVTKPQYQPLKKILPSKPKDELIAAIENYNQSELVEELDSLRLQQESKREVFSKKSITTSDIKMLNMNIDTFKEKTDVFNNISNDNPEAKLTSLLQIKSLIPDILEGLQMQADIRFNQQIDEAIAHNSNQDKIAERISYLETELAMLDELLMIQHREYNNYINDQTLLPYLHNFSYLLDQMNIETRYKEMYHKYLQNMAYIKQQNEKYGQLMVVLEKMAYIKAYSKRQIVSLTASLAAINYNIKMSIEEKTKRIQEIEDILKLETHLKNYREIQEGLAKITSSLQLKQTYQKLISQEGGIKDTIINRYLEVLANSINLSLSTYYIKLASDQNNGIRLSIYKNNKELNVQQLSGYETFALEIATKRALNIFSTVGTSQLFIMDEGFDVIDASNLEYFSTLLQDFKTTYKHVILISHDENIKSMVEHTITPDSIKSI